MTEIYKDMLDQQLEIGDIITYSGMIGSSAVLRLGRIIEFSESKEPNRYTGLKPPKIKVKAVMLDYKGIPESIEKLVTLEHFSRICKIPESSLNPVCAALL